MKQNYSRKTKIAVITCAALAFMAAWKLFCPMGESKNAPAGVKLVPDIVHLGKLKPGAKKTKQFIVENLADFPIEVAEMAASCNCTSAKLSKNKIAARDLNFFDAHGKKLAERSVNVRVSIDGPFEAKPKTLFFGTARRGKQISGQITFSSKNGEPFECKQIIANELDEFFQFGPISSTPAPITISFLFSAKNVTGPVSKHINFVLRSEHHARMITVPVLFDITP